MDISAMTNSMSSWKMPAIPYLDIWSERSSRNLIATRIIRSALKSFYRYVDKFPPLFQSFSHCESVFVSSKSTSSPWIWPLCYSTTKPHTHTHSRNVEVRSAKWCEFQYFVSAVKREQSLRESTYTPGQLLVQECKARQKNLLGQYFVLLFKCLVSMAYLVSRYRM